MTLKIPSHKKFKFEEKYRFPRYESDDLQVAWLFAKILLFKTEKEKPDYCDIQDKTLVKRGGETAELIDKAIQANDDHLLCELRQSTEERSKAVFVQFSPVNLRFDLKQIETAMKPSFPASFGLPYEHIKSPN